MKKKIDLNVSTMPGQCGCGHHAESHAHPTEAEHDCCGGNVDGAAHRHEEGCCGGSGRQPAATPVRLGNKT